ncbi:hypothetical protein PCL1606_57230 [Pseudomonas chlororaphis]|uniref:Uncharacterized protein n=1 Tax=Pseudomonas chlororaphis TaxID=587753 RepID=A0A0D5Y882_9PSED|nr:hypothetical protein PCL1606_57230 [Pseudomonas chlororaphis]
MEQADQGEGNQGAKHRGGRHQGKGRPSMPAPRGKKNASKPTALRRSS